MPITNADHKRARSEAARRAGKRSAEHRRCPKCGRGAAIKRIEDGASITTYCRWVLKGLCTYEKFTDLTDGGSS